MQASEVLNRSLETLLLVFFNTSEKAGKLMVESTYRVSKFAAMPADTYTQTARSLTQKYDLEFRWGGGATVSATIVNDLGCSLDEFLAKVYQSILLRLDSLPDGYDLDREMALAIFLPRGSVDFNRSLYAVDLKNATTRYVDNIFKLLLSSQQLLEYLNLNFRELQPQFTSREVRRNTQIRVNLKWFYTHALRGTRLNEYKLKVLENNLQNLGEERKLGGFEERMVVYRGRVLGHVLSAREIETLRHELEFERSEFERAGDAFSLRNQKVVAFAREILDDVCVGCQDKYQIDDRSFMMPHTGKHYLEINHVIAYASGSTAVDVVDNLVKLCPVCHRALTPGRAEESLQKEIIGKMIKSRPEVESFVNSRKPAGMSAVEFVFSKLR